jgi:hypothetical protein
MIIPVGKLNFREKFVLWYFGHHYFLWIWFGCWFLQNLAEWKKLTTAKGDYYVQHTWCRELINNIYTTLGEIIRSNNLWQVLFAIIIHFLLYFLLFLFPLHFLRLVPTLDQWILLFLSFMFAHYSYELNKTTKANRNAIYYLNMRLKVIMIVI